VNSSTLGSLLVLAATAAASPFSLVAFGLVLATNRGPRNGFAFILGWITTVMLIGIVTAIVGSSTTITSSNTPGAWTLALELALGVVLLVLWTRRRFRPRPPEEEVKAEIAKPVPGWQRRIDSMGYVGAFVLGGAVQTWPVMIAAGAEVVRADHLNAWEKFLAMFVFAVLTTTGIAILEVLAIREPGSAARRLDRMRNYIDGHRDAVINWAYLLGGLWLAFRGLIGLIT
jgi:threonine/homoserine/homoserine lactone efflux protein